VHMLFMGTAAAEGVPSIFCSCSTRTAARVNRAKDIRQRSSVLINDELLIDLGPDLCSFCAELGMFLGEVRYVLQTHPHEDHLDGLSLYSRHQGTFVQGVHRMTWYCAQAVVDRVNALTFNGESRFETAAEQEVRHLTVETIKPWQEMSFGRYRVQTVEANHDDGAQAMLFAIEDTRTGGRLFYGTDTGPLPDGTWTQLAELGWVCDVFVLDHTSGWGPRYHRHMNHEQFQEEVQAARACGPLRDDTRVIGTHFAHHTHPPHEEFVARAAAAGYEPAWDGLCVDTR
jgi:phosphoribosyl 1,2-cyclic phosphate phosphodiesterase